MKLSKRESAVFHCFLIGIGWFCGNCCGGGGWAGVPGPMCSAGHLSASIDTRPFSPHANSSAYKIALLVKQKYDLQVNLVNLCSWKRIRKNIFVLYLLIYSVRIFFLLKVEKQTVHPRRRPIKNRTGINKQEKDQNKSCFLFPSLRKNGLERSPLNCLIQYQSLDVGWKIELYS